MTNTGDAVIEAVTRLFGEAELASVLATLDQYGTEPYEREPERVQIALVTLAAGDKEALSKLVRIAKQDYRDILCWAQTGPASVEEGTGLQAAVRQLIEHWGRK